MKKTFFGTLAFVLMSLVLLAQDNLPAFKWEKMMHQFGKITQGDPVTVDFKFTNVGKTPLIISNARGSCGCTGVNYPKEPIAPNETAHISATFNAATVGTFNKSVTVDANTSEAQVVLSIQGEVVAK